MPTCPACSFEVSADSQICPKCGTSTSPPSLSGGGIPSDISGDRTTVEPGSSSDSSAPLTFSSSGDEADGPPRFVPGTMVDRRYRIVGLLGRGGMGEVYRADDLKLGQSVALKFLPEGLERDPDRLQRFLTEVRTARQVTHAHVCRVYDIGEVDGRHFLSMEYVDGEDLSSLLRRIGRLPQERAITVARQICSGLAAAHEQGILHRDLKPANVMIDGRGQVRLMDFGLAGLAESFAADRVHEGTPAYMAPEQISGEGVSVRSDLYALGLVLYELFTGRQVFEAKTVVELRQLHQSSAPSRPSSHVGDLDPAVESVVLRCLEKNPTDRPSSAHAVSAALPGGDPLAAALAAGETPSPEMVAEAGGRDALSPGKALLWALVGLTIFFGATRWAGTQTYLQYLPLDTRPEVLMDRSQKILAELGFVEPAYSDPVDQAWGLIVWQNVFEQVAAADSSASRWEGLTDRPEAASFWYRQSPRFIYPSPSASPVFLRGPVTLTNPPALEPGEVSIVLDLAERLRRFQVRPKRYATEDPAPVDWGPLFRFADLDTSRFTEVQPRYQRYFDVDRSRAWVGTRENRPDIELRVEAGAHQGRPVLFNVSSPGSLDSLGEDPEPVRPDLAELLVNSSTPVVILILIGLAALLARRNIRAKRADTLGATRASVVMFVLFVVGTGLDSHSLFTPAWALEIWPLIAGGSFFALIGWLLYCAAEPLGRQVWPTMFISSGRLLSRPKVQWRDPLLGRSVLVGIVAGAVVFAWNSGAWRLFELWQADAPPTPASYDLSVTHGQREALGAILSRAMTIGMAFLHVVALVVSQYFVKRRRVALAITVVVWAVVLGIGSLESVFFNLVASAIMLAVLLRWGVFALVVLDTVFALGWLARCPDLSAWYAQGAIMSLVAMVLLTIYGVWAATAETTTEGAEHR